MEELSFSQIETKIKSFIDGFNVEACLYLDVLYRFEEAEFEEVLVPLRKCRLPKKYTSYKDVLDEVFTKKLSLSNNDLFLYTDDVIYIKRFFQIDLPPDMADRRSCGIAPDILEGYKKAFFPENEHKKRMIELLTHAIESTLSLKKINPSEFRVLFIPVMINIADIVVIERSELEDLHAIRGLSFYILREMFEEMLLFIAEDILFHFSNQEKKAIEFLGHFSIHETIDAKGNRYKPNPILDESNRAWNMTTIRSTMIQHKKSKQTLYDKRNDLLAIKKKVDTYKQEQKEIALHVQMEQKLYQEGEDKLEHIHQTLDRLEYSDAKEVKFVEEGEEKVFERKQLVNLLFKKEDFLLNQRLKFNKSIKELEQSLSNKEKEIYIWEKKYAEAEKALAVLESQGHPIDTQYEKIQRALAKTLSQR